jgi:hypothetical protein
MDSFFTEVQTLSQSNLTYIMRNYVDSKVKARYNSINQDEALSHYTQLSVIQASSNNDMFVRNDKLFIYDSGAFGECVRKPVKILENRERKTCGRSLVNEYNVVFDG